MDREIFCLLKVNKQINIIYTREDNTKMNTKVEKFIDEDTNATMVISVETKFRSTFDEILGWKYSEEGKPYMQMIDCKTRGVYVLEYDVFCKEYAKGRKLNPGEIVTFQDVPVIGISETKNAKDLDIWGNANYLKFVHKKVSIFNGRIEYLKDELSEQEEAKKDFAYHVFEYIKEQCGNADAMFKQNLIAMVGIPGFHLLEEAGYIELAANVNGDELYIILEELEIE